MEKKALKIVKEESSSPHDIYDKLDELKAKYTFITDAMRNMMGAEDSQANDEIIFGFQLIMYSLDDEFEEIDTMLDVLLKHHTLLQSAEAGITMTAQGAWATKEKAIECLNEDIEKLHKVNIYSRELKREAEDLTRKAEELLKRLGHDVKGVGVKESKE